MSLSRKILSSDRNRSFPLPHSRDLLIFIKSSVMSKKSSISVRALTCAKLLKPSKSNCPESSRAPVSLPWTWIQARHKSWELKYLKSTLWFATYIERHGCSLHQPMGIQSLLHHHQIQQHPHLHATPSTIASTNLQTTGSCRTHHLQPAMIQPCSGWYPSRFSFFSQHDLLRHPLSTSNST